MSIMSTLRERSSGVVVCAALLALAVSSVCAQTVLPNADPGIEGEGFVTYAGHYGEVLKMRGGWEIRPSMHGEAEVINHYPGYRFISADLTDPFNPKPEDFVPENFSRDRLIQLIVLPWSASSSKSLEALKPQKIADLKASGVEFRIIDDPWLGYGSWNQRWPKGTFEVFIASPYLLSQLYTSSGKHLVILTTGRDKPPSTVISSHSDQLRMSLRDWVAPEAGDEDPKTYGPVPARGIPEEGISLRVFAKPKVWMSWVFISGIACLLFGVLGAVKRWDPVRRASLSLLIFSNMGALIGGLVGLAFWPFAWSSQHLTVPPAVACLFMPLLVWLVGRIRKRRPRRRAMVGTTMWALALVAYLGYIGLAWSWGADWSPHVPANTAVNTFILYAIGGILFGFLDSASNAHGGGRKLSILVLMLASAPGIWAQPVPIEKALPNRIGAPKGNAVFRARQRLAAHGLDRRSFEKLATAKLRETQVIYQYQRVEIKGIFAKDDTNDTLRNLFDKQIEASHVGDKGNSVIANPAWVQDALNHSKDLKDLLADAHGAFTETARRAVEELENKEVNEIVAHSWGTEIIYNAILAGKINSPRRLIVCGMPDRDMEKWVALSKHTGTEVVVYANSHDPAARAARVVGGIIDGSETSSEKIARKRIEENILGDTGPAKFEAQWEAACQLRPCNPHARQPTPPNFDYAYKGATHSRLAYYQAMIKDGAIPFGESDAHVLRKRQEAKIAAETERLYGAAVAREVANEGPESAQTRSELGFLGSWREGTAAIAENTKAIIAAQEAEREARRTREKDRERLEREEQERQARQAEEDTRAARELAAGPRRTPLDELNVEAARCGYKIRYDTDGKTMLGFGGFLLGRYPVPFDFGDLKVVFLMTSACQEIEANANRPAPAACNGAASLLRERVGRGDFVPKLKYLAMYPRTGYSMDESKCIQELLTNADKITDTQSFNKFVASYQKRLNAQLAKEAKRDRERKRDGREEGRPPRDEDDRTPPRGPDHDEVWRRLPNLRR